MILWIRVKTKTFLSLSKKKEVIVRQMSRMSDKERTERESERKGGDWNQCLDDFMVYFSSFQLMNFLWLPVKLIGIIYKYIKNFIVLKYELGVL